MPAIRTYTVTRTQTVEVSTAYGYEAALGIGLATLDGDTVRMGSVLVHPDRTGERSNDHTKDPVTRSVHVDLGGTR